MKGDDEIIIRDVNWSGNGATGCTWPRPTAAEQELQPDQHLHERRPVRYKAFVSSVNGTIKGGHLVTASFTVADKKNINDDFSPALTDYPSDPANPEAEWGRARADERYRFTASGGVPPPGPHHARSHLRVRLGPAVEPPLGYDYNGDGKSSDRKAGVDEFSEDGPDFKSVQPARDLPPAARAPREADLIAECFNLFNWVNYDVNSLTVNGPSS